MEENLDEIEQKISSLINYKSGLINELKKLDQKKRELRYEIKEITNKMIEEKKIISEQNLLIMKLRDSHKNIFSKINDIRIKVKNIEKTLKNFEKEIPHESGASLKEKLNNIEWRLQTEPLTRDKEKQFIEYIKKLEVELYLWEKAYTTRQELSDLLAESRSLKDKLDELNEMKKLAFIKLKTQKETLHNIIITKRQLIQECKEIERDMDEIRRNLNHVDAELFKLKEYKNKILEKKRIDEMASIRMKEQSLLEEVRSKAKDKLKKGKSLSWDELKVLFEDK
ncbi:MAG: hypothetical protein QW830_03540, partial [Nitrososphaerales archaeon]